MLFLSLETMRLFDVEKEQVIKYAKLILNERHGLPTTHALVNVFLTHKLAEDWGGVKPNSYRHGDFKIN